MTPIRRALISVSDKTGIVEFARFLSEHGVDLLSTGGSARLIAEAGVPVTQVSAHTGFPEILDGRLKTLHPKIHGGLLARRDDPAHLEAMTDYGLAPIDLLVASLYPFEETVAAGADFASCIENIDVGGPAMIRSAAKNHAFVTVVTDSAEYGAVMAAMEANGNATDAALRRRLAAAAFARTAAYDAAIAQWFSGEVGEQFPARFTLAGRLAQVLRYGENPHQQAALYHTAPARPGPATAAAVQGKPLSYNNLADADAALALVAEFDRPAAVIVKHGNPCGAAEADDLDAAFDRALAADRDSAFGGVIAVNRHLDAHTANSLAGLFVEVIIAPDATAEAREVLAAKPSLRLLLTGPLPVRGGEPGLELRSIAGGLLVQTRDAGRVEAGQLETATRRAPTTAEAADLLFAWRVAKHVRSNAVVIAKDGATLGIGAGQMSRVDAAKLAVAKAGSAADAVAASDGFFPFPDGLQALAAAGVRAVIQPGGSVRDGEVIAAADAAGLAMAFTGTRHFKH